MTLDEATAKVSRYLTEDVRGVMKGLEEKILSVDSAEKVTGFGQLFDAFNDAGLYLPILRYISDNGKVPYVWTEKVWVWYFPHANNSQSDHDDSLKNYHWALPNKYTSAKLDKFESSCFGHTFEEVMFRLIAVAMEIE